MSISISIVTYNSRNDIDDVLQSIARSNISDKVNVYVIDNASSDGTADYVEEKYHNLEIIRSSKNVGYGGGHNSVLNKLESDIHFVINPDILFDSSLLENMIDFLKKNEDVVLAIPNVINEEGKGCVVPRKKPTVKRLIGSYLGGKRGLLKKWRDDYYFSDADMMTPFEIEICSGCFMAVRTSAFKSIGGFDQRFFLYFEDFDLSRQLCQFGRIMCNPLLSVKHRAKREGHTSFRGFFLLLVSMVKYFNKWGWSI